MSVACCGSPRFSAASQISQQQKQAKKAQVNFAAQTHKPTAQPKFGCLVEAGVALGCCGVLVCGVLGGVMALIGKGAGAVKNVVSS